MRRLIWTCDRCGTEVDVADRIVICDEYTPSAVRYGGMPEGWRGLPGWRSFADDHTVTDVCPGCITAGEHVDQALEEAEFDFILGPQEQV